jgi:hypothetical protein
MNILNSYPLPNTQGLNYNLQTVAPTVSSNTFQHVIRVDYQASSKLRVSAKYAGQNATVQTNPWFAAWLQRHGLPVPGDPGAVGDGRLHVERVHGLEGTWGLTAGEPAGNVPNSPVHRSGEHETHEFPAHLSGRRHRAGSARIRRRC